jgi:Domain of unknown function (DUF3819)
MAPAPPPPPPSSLNQIIKIPPELQQYAEQLTPLTASCVERAVADIMGSAVERSASISCKATSHIVLKDFVQVRAPQQPMHALRLTALPAWQRHLCTTSGGWSTSFTCWRSAGSEPGSRARGEPQHGGVARSQPRGRDVPRCAQQRPHVAPAARAQVCRGTQCGGRDRDAPLPHQPRGGLRLRRAHGAGARVQGHRRAHRSGARPSCTPRMCAAARAPLHAPAPNRAAA